jgi:hypothetical protein
MNRIVRQMVPLALIAAAVLTASACGTSSTAQPTTTAPPVPVAQSACADLGGTVADQTCRVYVPKPTYVVDMSFPVDYPDQKALSDVLKQEYDSFIDWVAQFAQPDRRRPYEMVVTAKTYSSGTPESGTRSLVLKVQSDTGLAHEGHPDTFFEALNYDLGTQAAITFDTLFKPGTQPLGVLNPIVLGELQKPGSVVNDDLSERIYQNFALTDDAVIFFFAQDQVIVDNSGSHQVSVPKSQLASVLA